MKYAILFFISLVYASCTTKKYSKQLLDKLDKTDEITITYFKNNNIDSVEKVVRITNAEQINSLVQILNSSSAKRNTSGKYSGSIHYFKILKIVQDVFFTIDAKTIDFKDNDGQWQAIDLSNTAIDLIQQTKTQK